MMLAEQILITCSLLEWYNIQEMIVKLSAIITITTAIYYYDLLQSDHTTDMISQTTENSTACWNVQKGVHATNRRNVKGPY